MKRMYGNRMKKNTLTRANGCWGVVEALYSLEEEV